MGRIEKIKRQLIEEANKRLLGEAYSGIIQNCDVPCDIWCKIKTAKSGSNGDVVKMIQHLLFNGGYNENYSGGGMTGESCKGKWQHCDGKFRGHTKDAVIEFQRAYGLTPDGIVGYDTLSKMCEELTPSYYTSNFTLCEKQCRCGDIDSGDDSYPIDNVEIDVDIDCDDLRDCVNKYIFGDTAPDMSGFISCYHKKDMSVGKDKDFCTKCKETFPNNYVNLMPYPGKDEKEEAKRELGKLCIEKCDGFSAAY
jgi:hypothetical protein